jgi:hypothetical protein
VVAADVLRKSRREGVMGTGAGSGYGLRIRDGP